MRAAMLALQVVPDQRLSQAPALQLGALVTALEGLVQPSTGLFGLTETVCIARASESTCQWRFLMPWAVAACQKKLLVLGKASLHFSWRSGSAPAAMTEGAVPR